MKTIILAAGRQARLCAGKTLKQDLVLLDGTTIIERVAALANIHNTHPVIATTLAERHPSARAERVVVPISNRKLIVETLRYMLKHLRTTTDDTNICVLLGDVIYSYAAAEKIMGGSYNDPVFFIDNTRQKILAMRFDINNTAINNAIDGAIRYFYRRRGHGELWDIYCLYHGFPRIPRRVVETNTSFIDGWTTDIDTYDEWVAWRTAYADKINSYESYI